MAEQVRQAFERLFGAAHTGQLAALCERNAIALMVVFGSAVRPDEDPSDLDLAVRFAPEARRDLLAVLDDLYRLLGLEAIDVMVLNDAGPVARERALVQGQLLYQAESGLFATEQIAAIMERLDTDYLRRLELELMSR